MFIQTLIEIREDGREVPSTMTGIEMLKLGWPPSLIKKVKWTFQDKEYSYQSPYALSACIVPGAQFVAIVESTDMQHKSSLLRLLSANGESQITVPNEQNIHGRIFHGQFEWFSNSESEIRNRLGIIFRSSKGSDAFLLYIDAATGDTIKAEYVRA